MSLLRDADIGAHALDKMHVVRDAHLSIEGDGVPDLDGPTFAFIRHDTHPSGRGVDLVALNAIRPRLASVVILGPMPKPGVHTRSVLAPLGYDAAEVGHMIANRIAAERWCAKYLPE